MSFLYEILYTSLLGVGPPRGGGGGGGDGGIGRGFFFEKSGSIFFLCVHPGAGII